MKLGAEDFRLLYALMPDEELLSLNCDELTPVARGCYQAELLRRSLTAAPFRPPVAAAMAPPDDRVERVPIDPEEQEEEDLAAATVCPGRDEAQSARAVLQAAGIPAFLENDGPAGFRVLVPASYVTPAREALASPAEDGPA